MEFEYIGGNSRTGQYSLYDYSENTYGETVMSIEVHFESGSWWFVGQPKSQMNSAHMDALSELLLKIKNKKFFG